MKNIIFFNITLFLFSSLCFSQNTPIENHLQNIIRGYYHNVQSVSVWLGGTPSIRNEKFILSNMEKAVIDAKVSPKVCNSIKEIADTLDGKKQLGRKLGLATMVMHYIDPMRDNQKYKYDVAGFSLALGQSINILGSKINEDPLGVIDKYFDDKMADPKKEELNQCLDKYLEGVDTKHHSDNPLFPCH